MFVLLQHRSLKNIALVATIGIVCASAQHSFAESIPISVGTTSIKNGDAESKPEQLKATEDALVNLLKKDSAPPAEAIQKIPVKKVVQAQAPSKETHYIQPGSQFVCLPDNETKDKLKVAEGKISKLKQDLEEAQNRLVLAETEVESLSKALEKRQGGKSVSARSHSDMPARINPMVASIPQMQEDVQVATVLAEKAYLRSGPGKNNSPVMALTRGARLTIETREGGWYRVFAPNGTRAWIDAEVVALGAQTNMQPPLGNSLIENNAAEDEALKAITKRNE